MLRRTTFTICAISVVTAAYGCSSTASAPTAPAAAVAGTDAAADGSTLKVTAPGLVSPINTVQLDTLSPLFTFSNATAKYGAAPTLSYRIEISTPAGAPVAAATVPAGSGTTKWQYPGNLALDQTFRWRVRAEMGGAFGPWTAFGTFRSLDYRGLNPRPANGQWPNNPDDLLDYIANAWDDYLQVTALTAQRIANMEFVRDRLIEAGICGGIDLAWNLKRGVGPHSHDAIAWRKPNGFVEVVDIASAFDDKTIPLMLHWAIVAGPSGYDRYTNHPGC